MTSFPTAANIRFTWWNFPSVITVSARDGPSTRSSAGFAVKSPKSIPAAKASTAASVSSPSTSARYRFVTCLPGLSRRWFNSPSHVRISSPVVSLSSRPTGMHPMLRYTGGSRSITVGCFASRAAVRSPPGLCIITWRMTRPSISLPFRAGRSSSVSKERAGSRMIRPFTAAFPPRIHSLTSLRLPRDSVASQRSSRIFIVSLPPDHWGR